MAEIRKADSQTFRFHEVFREEIKEVNKRRGNSRPAIVLEEEGKDNSGEPILRPKEKSNVVGLSLSGGGIRSAAFCLGVLQALDTAQVLGKIDYLSTVSGGGYIGSSLSAGMSVTGGAFPFPSRLGQDEPPALQHIRDHSNYLFPRGLSNLFCNIVIYLRGIMANVLLLLPVLLFAAAFTILSNPEIKSLARADIAGVPVWLLIKVPYFGLTLNLLFLFAIFLVLWAVRRSIWGRTAETGCGCQVVGLATLAILAVAFSELQPTILVAMFAAKGNGGGLSAVITSITDYLAPVLAAFAAIIAFLGKYLADILKWAKDKPGRLNSIIGVATKIAFYVAGAAVPLGLWVIYLYLSYWGICSDGCGTADPKMQAPLWLLATAHQIGVGPLGLYVWIAAILTPIGLFLSPNANSLHRLYRDRLSKAFLFHPDQWGPIGGCLQKLRRQSKPAGDKTGSQVRYQDHTKELVPLEDFKLANVDCLHAPYHLINAALNIGGSKYANSRGRDADFFIFSPKFTGSEATRYVETSQIEEDAGINLATAMAISGAAASSNMGSNTIKPLVPTLAILNVRLGYWLVNPVWLAAKRVQSSIAKFFDSLYFLHEIFGLLREDSGVVYLTDGGHVENLGIYELLRRRCRIIIAVDAEADSEMSFGSFVTLQRYARIDLGTTINLPWADIRNATRTTSDDIMKTGGSAPESAPHGPHCALGEISYPSGGHGYLVYVKAALTGDENDYIVDYKRRNSSYPHETTADQLFSEEQFEVYRALGFHAAHEMFCGRDQVAMKPEAAKWMADLAADHPVTVIRSILDWKTD